LPPSIIIAFQISSILSPIICLTNMSKATD
jgi:hypothetical protein